MAAKARKGAHPGKKPAAKTATKARGRPKGLQLSAAQLKAYSKAFNAAATAKRNALVLQAVAKRFRHYRLQAAYATNRQYAKAYQSAQAAATAAYAAHRSFVQSQQSHQNLALQHRIAMDAFRHGQLLGRAMYAQAGVKAYAHKAVMRTVTQGQAVSHEQARLKALIRAGKKVRKSVRRNKKPPRPTAQSAAILAAGKAAGAAAARAVKGGGKATTTGGKRGRPLGSKASTVKGATKAAKQNARAAAASRKAPAKNAKGRACKPPWAGDEYTPNCVVTAIVNNLLRTWGVTVTEADVKELEEACGPEPPIEEVLWQAWMIGWPSSSRHRLKDYRRVDEPAETGGLIIGYETEYGPHAALSLQGGSVVSWGEVMKREAPIEEAWFLIWQS